MSFPAPFYHEDMRAYIIRRLLLVVPTLFILSILVFLSVRFIPGDVMDVLEARMQIYVTGGIDRAALERRLGLDVPVWVQYGRWMGALPTPDRVTGESHFRGLLQRHPWRITVWPVWR